MTSSDLSADPVGRRAWAPSDTEPVPVVPDHEVFPQPIGTGSYGVVFLAKNIMDTWRAVKVVYRARFDSKRPYEREFDAVRRFEPVSRSHPSQLNLLQVGEDPAGRYFYYVMELADPVPSPAPCVAAQPIAPDPPGPTAPGAVVNGPPEFDPAGYRPHTLASDLRRQGRLPFAACLDIGLALSTALDHLHRAGLVHRDIKPTNIVFVNGLPKLADIGLVTAAGAATRLGTEGYIPPEGTGTPAADVFSLGRVLYECTTGRDATEFPELPVGFEDFADHDRLLELNAAIVRAGSCDLAERYPSADALHAALVAVQAGRSLERQRRLERALNVARFAVVIVALVGLGAWATVRIRANQRIEALRVSEEKKAEARALVREAQTIRLNPRQSRWASNSIETIRKAARIDRDNDARQQAAAAFLGYDAWTYQRLDRLVGTAVTFDRAGRRVAFTGGANWLGVYVPSRILDLAGGPPQVLGPDQRGLVTFDPDGTVALFSWASNGVLTLRDPAQPQQVLRAFDRPQGRAAPRLRDRPPMLRSPDGAWFAAAAEGTNGPGLAVWRVADGHCVGTLQEPANALAFSPDSTVLATGHEDGHITIHALPDLRPLMTIEPSRAPVLSLALGEDPQVHVTREGVERAWLVAVGTAGGTIYVCDTATRTLRGIYRGSSYDVYAVAFHPDRMTLMSCGRQDARFWDIATGQLLLRLDEVEDFGVALAISPDGATAALGTQYPFNDFPGLYLIRIEPERGIRTLRGLSTQVSRVRFSPDGRRVAALAHDWQVGVWLVASNRLEHVFAMPRGRLADNAALRFSLDGRHLAFATYGAAVLWDLEARKRVASWSTPPGWQQALTFDTEGRLLLFQREQRASDGHWVGHVRLLGANDPPPVLTTLPEFDRAIYGAAFTPDGACLLVCGRGQNDPTNQHTLKIVVPATGRILFATNYAYPRPGDGFRIDPGGRFFGRGEPGPVISDLDTGKTTLWRIPDGAVLDVVPSAFDSFGAGGRWLAITRGNRLGIQLRQRPSVGPDLVLSPDHMSHFSPKFSPDGQLMAWGTDDGLVFVANPDDLLRRLADLGL